MRRLSSWLVEHGTIYVETQVTNVKSDLPIFEYASDVYPTTAHQDKASLGGVGISNYPVDAGNVYAHVQESRGRQGSMGSLHALRPSPAGQPES